MSILTKRFLIAALAIAFCAPQAWGAQAEAYRRNRHGAGALGPALALLVAGTIIGLCAAASRSVSESGRGKSPEARLPDPSDDKWALIASMSDEMRGQAEEIIRLCGAPMESEDSAGGGTIKRIHSAGVTLSELINDVRETARAGAENFTPAQEEYETPALINDVMSLNTARLGDETARLSFRVDGSFPSRLRGDALKVRRIFNNILSCALRHARGGAVNWELSREAAGMDGGAVWVVSRVSCEGGAPGDGGGTGMSAAKRMIETMHGSLTVEAGQRASREFTARFRQRAAGEGTIGSDAAMKLCALNSGGCRGSLCKTPREMFHYACVLLADSMESSLERTKGILKPYGVRVDCVDSGHAAVELIMAEDVKYDAILIDHLMPGMNGFKTVRDIRGIGTEYARKVPMIALSPDSPADGEAMFLPMGFQAFVEKPVDVILLNSLISGWTRGGNETQRAYPAHEIFARETAEESGGYGSAHSIMA
jgi:CheY-like chemotaxis protein